MSYKVNEHNGNWSVIREVDGFVFPGLPIQYEQYKELKDIPHAAARHFQRDKKGLLKPRKKT